MWAADLFCRFVDIARWLDRECRAEKTEAWRWSLLPSLDGLNQREDTEGERKKKMPSRGRLYQQSLMAYVRIPLNGVTAGLAVTDDHRFRRQKGCASVSCGPSVAWLGVGKGWGVF